jgi:gluconolactonase
VSRFAWVLLGCGILGFVLGQMTMIEHSMERVMDPGSVVQRVATGMQLTEGPVWMREGYLVFSDIPANELKKYTVNGPIETYRTPSERGAGNALDRLGRLITCEQGTRRLVFQETDGEVRPLIDRVEGKRFNGPYEVVVQGDGTVWFTDPDHGVKKEAKDLEGSAVYCYDPGTRRLKVVASDFDQPKGLCFSPDESKLYIAEGGKSHQVRVFEVGSDHSLRNGKVFATIEAAAISGIRMDESGRLFCAAGKGIHLFDPEGKVIGKIPVSEPATNLCFGGSDRKTLFITARTSLYRIDLRTRGNR